MIKINKIIIYWFQNLKKIVFFLFGDKNKWELIV